MKKRKYLLLKSIFLILNLALFSLQMVGAENHLHLDWQTYAIISTESTEHSLVPSIAVDDKNNIFITWEDMTNFDGCGTDQDIFFKFWNATSMSWTTTEVVSTESTSFSIDPSIGIDDKSNVYIAWYDSSDYEGCGTDFDVFYKYWNATSKDWNTTEVISINSASSSQCPSLAVDVHGNVHITWHDGGGFSKDILYKCWNATNMSWQLTEEVSTESSGSLITPAIALADNGDIHIAWVDDSGFLGSGSDRDIFYKFWNATSMSWTTTEVVSTASTESSYHPSLGLDNRSNVHIVWHDYTNYSNIFYKFWNATSMSWTATEIVSSEASGEAFSPSLFVDNKNNVHVSWNDNSIYDVAGPDPDIFYKFWNATSMSWTTTEVVSTQCSGNSDDPSVVVDLQGYVYVCWEDDTLYSGSGSGCDIFCRTSNPFFTPPLPITTEIPIKSVSLLFMIVITVFVVSITKIIKRKRFLQT